MRPLAEIGASPEAAMAAVLVAIAVLMFSAAQWYDARGGGRGGVERGRVVE